MPVQVVLDAAVIVGAFSQVGPAAAAFPAVPPLTGQRHSDALGVFTYPDPNFALIVTEKIVEEVLTALTGDLLAWGFDEADEAIQVLDQLADGSGGGLVTPELDVELPKDLGEAAASAIQAACSTDMGYPRVVVTEDSVGLTHGPITPRGIPFPMDQRIEVIDPERFAKIAQKVRWKMRPAR